MNNTKEALINMGTWMGLGILVGWFFFSQDPDFIFGAACGSFVTFIALALGVMGTSTKKEQKDN